MDIKSLGYLRLATGDLNAWKRFAGDVLGMVVEEVGGGASLRLKMDDRPFRIAVESSGEQEGITAVGWELAHPDALEQAMSECKAAGIPVWEASPDDCAERGVRCLFRAADPSGYMLEFFCTPRLDHRPFVSPIGVSGFVTGELGLGHVVLPGPDLQASRDFYMRHLGFRLSDRQVRRDGSQAFFLHCNARHHSLALIGDLPVGLHHFMVEVSSIDDVGYAFDRFLDFGVPILRGIGKHANDQMISFYAQTPSGFGIEYGCGGIHVDDRTWTTGEITKSSLWGHRSV